MTLTFILVLVVGEKWASTGDFCEKEYSRPCVTVKTINCELYSREHLYLSKKNLNQFEEQL